MPKLASLNREFGPQGLLVIGAHAQNATPDKIRTTALSRGANFTIVENANLKGGNDFSGIPHVVLFDHTGKCVYRGSPDAAEAMVPKLLAAAPAPVLEGRKLTKLTQEATQLKKESNFPTVLQAVKAKTSSKDTATAEEANYVVEKIGALAKKQFDQAKAQKEAAPHTALALLQNVANHFKGTDAGKEAAEEVASLKKDKDFQNEVKVGPMLEDLRKLEGQLQQPSSGLVDTKSKEFQALNAAALGKMNGLIRQMKKAAPEAKATKEAIQLGEQYGLKG
jgi:hypothetical protein